MNWLNFITPNLTVPIFRNGYRLSIYVAADLLYVRTFEVRIVYKNIERNADIKGKMKGGPQFSFRTFKGPTSPEIRYYS